MTPPPIKYFFRSNLSSLLHFNSPDVFYWINNSIGYYRPSQQIAYDDAYFDKYASYANTELGQKLNAFRATFVNKHLGSLSTALVDVGIGAGTYLESHEAMYPNRSSSLMGYDVNPKAIKILKEKSRFLCVDASSPEWEGKKVNMTMFDVLEHIATLAPYLFCLDKLLVCSVPIFRDLTHVLSSKHFKPGEHIWYFTESGLVDLMNSVGLRCVESTDRESELGRENIKTFAFYKVSQ